MSVSSSASAPASASSRSLATVLTAKFEPQPPPPPPHASQLPKSPPQSPPQIPRSSQLPPQLPSQPPTSPPRSPPHPPPAPPQPQSAPPTPPIPPTPPEPRRSAGSRQPRSRSVDASSQRHLARRASRRERRMTGNSPYPGGSPHTPPTRWPYHEYVHQVAEAGWENLEKLDQYMSSRDSNGDGDGDGSGNGNDNGSGKAARDIEDRIPPKSTNDFIISVLDIGHDYQKKIWPDIRSAKGLHNFFASSKEGKERDRSRAKTRIFVAEYNKLPPPVLIEIFGSALALDPRFWTWAIHAKDHVFMPSDRHRAPYLRLGFASLKEGQRENSTDANRIGAMLYAIPDEEGDGWTGLVLFDSRINIKMSVSVLHPPPRFKTPIIHRDPCERRSFRELYLETFDFMSLESATLSPFYAFHTLFRLNNHLWTNIVSAIREADHRINGISTTSIGHAEEISKTKHIVERGGSLSWKGSTDTQAIEKKKQLEEDFTHLVEQTDLLWQNRSKMTQIRQRRTEARWASLTNAFTYLRPASHRLRS